MYAPNPTTIVHAGTPMIRVSLLISLDLNVDKIADVVLKNAEPKVLVKSMQCSCNFHHINVSLFSPRKHQNPKKFHPGVFLGMPLECNGIHRNAISMERL
jgi:hypothetical protein